MSQPDASAISSGCRLLAGLQGPGRARPPGPATPVVTGPTSPAVALSPRSRQRWGRAPPRRAERLVVAPFAQPASAGLPRPARRRTLNRGPQRADGALEAAQLVLLGAIDHRYPVTEVIEAQLAGDSTTGAPEQERVELQLKQGGTLELDAPGTSRSCSRRPEGRRWEPRRAGRGCREAPGRRPSRVRGATRAPLAAVATGPPAGSRTR